MNTIPMGWTVMRVQHPLVTQILRVGWAWAYYLDDGDKESVWIPAQNATFDIGSDTSAVLYEYEEHAKQAAEMTGGLVVQLQEQPGIVSAGGQA